jgi:hypothetical protein
MWLTSFGKGQGIAWASWLRIIVAKNEGFPLYSREPSVGFLELKEREMAIKKWTSRLLPVTAVVMGLNAAYLLFSVSQGRGGEGDSISVTERLVMAAFWACLAIVQVVLWRKNRES